MEISEVKDSIKSGKFEHWYIFWGEEQKVLKIYIDKMAEKLGYEKEYVDTILDVYSKIRIKSLISSPHLYVVMDDKDFLTNEDAWEAIGNGNDFKDDMVVFWYNTHDGRLKFWKRFQSRAVEFKRMDDEILHKHIKKELPLSPKNCDRLIDACEGDYGRILLEIDKVKQYAGESGADKTFETLMEQGAIYTAPKDAIFDFVSAVLDRDIELAFNLYEQSRSVGEASMVMLSVLYNNAKTLLQVQSSDNTKSLGLNGFAVKNVLPYRDRYSNKELVRMMHKIRECEKGIKTGEIPDDISVQKILVEVL